MLSAKQMQETIGLILLIGTLFSAAIVTIGGAMYLLQYGNENMKVELLQAASYHMSVKQILQTVFSFSAISIIEFGLLSLVATQTIRVALLCGFYASIKDYKFTLISIFILMMLIYSSFWRQ